jgi:hypothetical protein
MHILKTLVGAALLFVAITCNAQDYTIRRDPFGTPFGPAYNVYNQSGQLQQQIRRDSFGTPSGPAYNVYGPSGQLQQQIRRDPFGTPFGPSYNVHTMPLFNH